MPETFNLTLEDAEFVVDYLPGNDEFTRDLQRWCEQERSRKAEREQAAQEHLERYAPIFNRFLWSAVGGYPFPDREAQP